MTSKPDLIAALERAEGASYDLFRKAFDIVFPEPARPRAWTWRWFMGDTDWQKWSVVEWHFEKLAARKQWPRLAVWLGGFTDSDACKLLAHALRATEGNSDA